MPRYDKRSGDIIIRVVYDGAPEAGKTTNIHALQQSLSLSRKGRIASPGTTSRRTEFFDWLDFQGGYVEGRRVRCQLVSVPGQSSLLRRRRYLLQTADAVVFVADSHRLLVAENRATFEQLRASIERLREDVPVGVILQANKQDRPGALDARALAERMGVDPTIPSFDAQANIGEGVKDTFLFAVRLAVERVKALALSDRIETAGSGYESPELLFELMQEDEARAPVTEEDDASAPATTPPDAPLTEPAPAPAEGSATADAQASTPTSEGGAPPATNETTPPQPVAEETVDGAPPATDETAPPQPVAEETVDADPDAWIERLRFPTASEIPAGCSWPPVTGRSAVAALEGAPVTLSEAPRSWAPPGVVELHVGNTTAHTHAEWCFDRLEDARRELVLAVRRCLEGPGRMPTGRALLLAPEGEAHRMWVVTHRLPTLAEELDEHLERGDVEGLAALLGELATVARTPNGALPLEHLAHEARHLVALPMAGLGEPSASRPLLADLEDTLSRVADRGGDERALLSAALVHSLSRFRGENGRESLESLAERIGAP